MAQAFLAFIGLLYLAGLTASSVAFWLVLMWVLQ
jgi:hypothetical protein